MMGLALTDVTGIGPAAAKNLEAGGIVDARALAKASEDKISEIPGFGPVRAAQVIAAAKALLTMDQSPAPAPKAPASPKDEAKPKKDKKEKSSKKDKKKKKKKDKDGKKSKKDKKAKKAKKKK